MTGALRPPRRPLRLRPHAEPRLDLLHRERHPHQLVALRRRYLADELFEDPVRSGVHGRKPRPRGVRTPTDITESLVFPRRGSACDAQTRAVGVPPHERQRSMAKGSPSASEGAVTLRPSPWLADRLADRWPSAIQGIAAVVQLRARWPSEIHCQWIAAADPLPPGSGAAGVLPGVMGLLQRV
jgi:hypothetical protein